MALFFTQWDDDTLGQAPDGWGQYGADQANEVFSVEDLGGGDRVLRYESLSGSSNAQTFLWDGAGGPGLAKEVEIVARIRFRDPAGDAVDAGLAGRSDQSTTNRYQADLQGNAPQNRLAKHTAGNFAQLLGGFALTLDLSVSPTDWVWIRLRLEGNDPTTVRGRWWRDDESEPASWDLETTDSGAEIQDAGYLGFTKFQPRGWEVSDFGVATEGDTAPTEPIGPSFADVPDFRVFDWPERDLSFAWPERDLTFDWSDDTVSLGTKEHDPDADLPYAFDLTSYLPDGVAVSSAEIASSPSGLTIGTPSVSSPTVTVQISGGTAGTVYRVACKVTLDNGDTDERSAFLRCREL